MRPIARAATALTTVFLTGASTAGLHHPGHLVRLLAVLAAVLGAHKPTAPFMYRPDGLSRVKGVHMRRAANLG